jgi:hypothetical protein
MSKLLEFKDGKLVFKNGRALCDVVAACDGYYVAYMLEADGYVNSRCLREAADLLDEMNAEWDEQVSKL